MGKLLERSVDAATTQLNKTLENKDYISITSFQIPFDFHLAYSTEMKQFITSNIASSPVRLEAATPTRHNARSVVKNPVLLALRNLDPSPQADQQVADTFRIANEILQRLEWLKAGGPSDGALVRAFREEAGRERIKQSCAALDSYLKS